MNYQIHLEQYEHRGYFTFNPQENLKDKCNAPKDKAGVYLIYRLEYSQEILLYIGSSGRKEKGSLRIRKGGLYDRLVNGHHSKFETSNKSSSESVRRNAFPREMLKAGIENIIIYWWVTHDENKIDFPTDVEKSLSDMYEKQHSKLPEWHK